MQYSVSPQEIHNSKPNNKVELNRHVLAHDEAFRSTFLESIRDLELRQGYPKVAVRDLVTGPVVDQLFSGAVFTRRLANGLTFDFPYTGRIAREFLLAPENPDHVWEPQTTRLLLHFAQGAQHVVVGGAYFGDHVVPMAHALKDSGGQVHAFEPTPQQHGFLTGNAARNGLSNVKTHCMGLWSVSGVSLKFDGADELASPEEAPEGEEGATPATSVDDYLSKQGIASIQLLMVDVEGGEYRVLQGALNQLRLPAGQAPVVVFETNSRYSDWSRGLENAETCVLLRDLGYQVYSIRDHHANIDLQGAPVELIPADRTYIEGPPHGFNMLAVKDPSVLENPLFKIVYDVSPKLILHKGDARFEPVP